MTVTLNDIHTYHLFVWPLYRFFQAIETKKHETTEPPLGLPKAMPKHRKCALNTFVYVSGIENSKLKQSVGRNAMTNLDSISKSRDVALPTKVYIANKGLYSQSYGFSSSHVQMRELAHKKG